jgi:gluconolactonase
MTCTSATERLDERGAGWFTAYDERFGSVVGDAPRLVRVVDADAHEGPVYVADEDALYFTTVPRRDGSAPEVSIKRLQLDGTRFPLEPERLSIVIEQANVANGMALDREGRLVICEQGTFTQPARIRRLDLRTRELETLVKVVGALPLNSPNDVVVRSDGTIWFTDPSYGYLQGFRPEPAVPDRIYRLDPASNRVGVAAIGFDKPNGLAFSPDEQTLYVADNGAPHHLLAFDVDDDRSLTGRRKIAHGTPEHPDGLKVDAAGRIYASARGGVQVFDPSGVLLGEIDLPGAVNFTFGGRDKSVLFITTDTAVWAAVLNTKGA